MGWIVTHPFAYPLLEVLHLLGIALLVGNLVLLEARVLGAGHALPLAELARLTAGLAVAGFTLVALSGLAMFASNPVELLANRAFTLKLGLVGLAGMNAAAFHARGGVQRLDAVARGQILLSLALWLAAMVAGRWIAYV
jgi:hypothetical protein